MTDLAEAAHPTLRSRPGAPAGPDARNRHAPSPALLADVYEAASRCNKCSLCLAVCPTYMVNPVEWESARGRVSLIRDAIEGKLELSEIVDGPLSTCLTCDNCMTACAPKVPTAHIVTRARQELADQRGLGVGRRLLLRGILPHPRALRSAVRLGRVSQRIGLYPLARRLGFGRWLGDVGSVLERVGPLPRQTAREMARNLPSATAPVRGRLGFLVCCYQNVASPEATTATMRVLLANGFDIEIPEQACSGLPARTLGDRESEIEMAADNTARLQDLKVDALVGDVASCTAQWQRYGELLSRDRIAPEAHRVSSTTWLASRYLLDHGLTAELAPLRWRVAIDQPCSLPLDEESRSVAAQLLGRIPRLEVVDLHEAETCCGGPGTYFASQPERSQAILQRKFENVVASGCEVLVTENISCLMQLRAGAAQYAPTVRVMHLFEVLDASISEAARRQTALR